MGLLAGSTVMLLTVLWGSCIIVGKCDLSDNSTSIDSQDTKAFSLFGKCLLSFILQFWAFVLWFSCCFSHLLAKILAFHTCSFIYWGFRVTHLEQLHHLGFVWINHLTYEQGQPDHYQPLANLGHPANR